MNQWTFCKFFIHDQIVDGFPVLSLQQDAKPVTVDLRTQALQQAAREKELKSDQRLKESLKQCEKLKQQEQQHHNSLPSSPCVSVLHVILTRV